MLDLKKFGRAGQSSPIALFLKLRRVLSKSGNKESDKDDGNFVVIFRQWQLSVQKNILSEIDRMVRKRQRKQKQKLGAPFTT